jgi:hypothetical protein
MIGRVAKLAGWRLTLPPCTARNLYGIGRKVRVSSLEPYPSHIIGAAGTNVTFQPSIIPAGD